MRDVLSKLYKEMSLIPKDKLLHFFYGTIISLPVVMLLTTMEALAVMLAVAILKEITDSVLKFSPPNALDALATFTPVLILLAVK